MTQAQAIAEALKMILGNKTPTRAVKAKGRGKKAKGREKMSDADKEAFRAQNDAECVAIFTKAGFKDVQPRVNVLTYGKVREDGTKTGWLAKGRRVKRGEKGVKVGPFALFHESQTQPEEVSAETATANQVAA